MGSPHLSRILRDVVRRHSAYATTILCVVTISRSPWILACVLTSLLFLVARDAGADPRFVACNSIGFPLVEAVAVLASRHTWVYAHPIPLLGVPAWLFPLWGLASIWVVDVQRLVDCLAESRATSTHYFED